MLERKIAKVGLITTRGFRDTLELGRRTRPEAVRHAGTFEPLIPRELRLEVDERMTRPAVITRSTRTRSRPRARALLAAAARASSSTSCIPTLTRP